MDTRTKRSGTKALVVLLTITYFVSYLTRYSYKVILDAVINSGFDKDLASLPLIGLSITYGTGQILSGFTGDRIQPKYLVGAGLIATTAMNALIPFCTSPFQMTVVWCINGLAQAFMWPPLVKLMSELFDYEGYSRATIAVTSGGYVGEVFMYIIAPVIIAMGSWKGVFIVSALSGIIMLVFWMFLCPKISLVFDRAAKADGKNEKKHFPWSVMLVCILGSIILMGTLRDGISSWMPNLVSETFNLGSEISILTGVIFPVFAIVSILTISEIRRRFVKNELKLSAILFAICTVCAVLVAFVRELNPILTVLLIGLMVSCMNGVNLMLISYVPKYYDKTGVVSLVSGVINACTYLGAAISIYAIAVVSENFGWTPTIIVWAATAFGGGILCLLQIRPWEKFSKDMSK